ncbi:hypothetical protein PUN28_013886 [Cardiocondyla obscurior]|uniref:Uncharacterized protein n=1 Tax=Cardiocondyla obscurior TaxID=286306 RepID=A0AAW2F8T6_9HYME
MQTGNSFVVNVGVAVGPIEVKTSRNTYLRCVCPSAGCERSRRVPRGQRYDSYDNTNGIHLHYISIV